jgi:hypothetical protein
MEKFDFKKEWLHLYQPPKKTFQVVDVPQMQFLKVDGRGDPNLAEEYTQAVEALYALAYRIKFISKAGGQDYVVPPLEGLWWAEDPKLFSSRKDKSRWDWTMMLMTPQWISEAAYHQAREEVSLKKDLPALSKVRREGYHEGLSAQILHIGSYDQEGPVLTRLHTEWMPENGYDFNGKHHEIYLGDPRRVEDQKLKTILRQPIRKIASTGN